MHIPPAKMKALLILVENSCKAEIKLFPFHMKVELISNILWVTFKLKMLDNARSGTSASIYLPLTSHLWVVNDKW